VDPSVASLLAYEIARRLQPLAPERIRLLPRSDGITVYETGSGPWGGVSLHNLDLDFEDEVEHVLSSLQDDVVHAVNGAWPPVGAPRLPHPWVRREGSVLRLGFEDGPELEPIPLDELGLA
jgi:hypothetical protein